MKKSSIYLIAAFLAGIWMAVGCSPSHMASHEKTKKLQPEMKLAVGQTVYACNCGPSCDCDTMSMKPGQCSCGADLVAAKVLSVDEGTATLMVSGEKRTFKTVGTYACACGKGCPCQMISQKPGKCSCGYEMEKVN